MSMILLSFLVFAAVAARVSASIALNLTATYSGSAAASWAVSCIPGCTECPECTSPDCSCGCTYFTTRKSIPFYFSNTDVKLYLALYYPCNML